MSRVEIDQPNLKKALRDVIKRTMGNEEEWGIVLSGLLRKDEKNVAFALKSKEWIVDREDPFYRFLENIIFNAIQSYMSAKKTQKTPLELVEEERAAVRARLVDYLPIAFSDVELKRQWAEIKAAETQMPLPLELKYTLRFAQEKANGLLKKTRLMPGNEIRAVFESSISPLKEKLETIAALGERGATLRNLNVVNRVRDELDVIGHHFPDLDDLYLQQVQQNLSFLRRIQLETEGLLEKINVCFKEIGSTRVLNEQILRSYAEMELHYEEAAGQFFVVSSRISQQSLRSTEGELNSIVSAFCRLQGEAGRFLTRCESILSQEETMRSRSVSSRGGFFARTRGLPLPPTRTQDVMALDAKNKPS